MIKKSFIFILFASLFFNYSSLSQDISWYRVYSGNIDKYPVVMNLYKKGHNYSGYYYYLSQQKSIYFTGEDTSAPGGKIKLAVYLPDQESEESFTFSISGKIATGKWSTDKKKNLLFSANETESAPGFDYIYTEGSTELRAGLKDSPVATFEAATVWPKGNSVQAAFLKKLIREEFGEKNSTEDIGKIFLKQKKEFFTGYINDNKDVKNEDLKDSYAYNLDENSELKIVYQSSKLLVLASSYYSYTGGAHGNYGTSYIPVDLLNNKKLVIGDILNKVGQAQLPKLLERYFRKDYKVKDSDPLSEGGLFDNKIAPNDNFYVSAKGIGFCYNPYEIGPYAMGEIEIFIPFTELNAYLQPGFKKLIQ